MGDVLTFAPRPRVPEVAADTPRPITEAQIRERLGAVLDNALDVADQIIAVLDRMDGCPDDEDGGDAEPSLGAPEGHESQVMWLRGGDEDREAEAPEIALPDVAVASAALAVELGPEPAQAEPETAAIVIPFAPLPWGGRGNVVAAAGVALLDLVAGQG